MGKSTADLAAMAQKRGARLQSQAGGLVDPHSEFQHTFEADVDKVRPAPDGQSRRHFDESALSDLANSIKAQGLLQPILVRPDEIDSYWIIVAGERRWRAHQMLGKSRILCIRVRPGANNRTVQLVENLQRQDLNPVEKAQGIRDLINEEGLPQNEVAAALSLSPASLSQSLSLLSDLAHPIIEEISNNGTNVSASVLYELSRLPMPHQEEIWPSVKKGALKRNDLRQARHGEGEGGGSSRPPTTSDAGPFRGYGSLSKSLDALRIKGGQLDDDQRKQLAVLRDKLNELLA